MEENNPSDSIDIKKLIKKNSALIVIVSLLLIIGLSAYVRTSNIKNLKDVTTGNYTLAPDLDPFLYLRNAHEIIDGKLANPDMMWSAPLGSKSYAYTSLMPWTIVGLYKFLNIFSETGVEYAAIILPVILTCFAVLFFFLFAQKIFSFMMKKEYSYLGALLAALLYAVVPQMIHRTTGGVPEIESFGMPFFWMAFYFFISAWQSEKIRSSLIFSALSGISTGLMVWIWGGYRYIFMSISLAVFIAFFFQKISKKNTAVLGVWWLLAMLSGFAKDFSLIGLLSSIPDFLFSTIVIFIIITDIVLRKFILSKRQTPLKMPRSLLSTIIAILLMSVLAAVFFGPHFIIDKVSGAVNYLIKPFGAGRVGLTVAENRAPYFNEVSGAFAVSLGGTAISLFWLFFPGTLLLFYEAVKHFGKKYRYILTLTFALFLIGFIFSRISSDSILNGENFISKALYFGSLLLLISVLVYVFFKEKHNLENSFYKINFSYLLLLSLVFFLIISMRGAVRLFFIVSPALIISSAYLSSKLFEYSSSDGQKKNTAHTFLLILSVIILVLIAFFALKYSQQSYYETAYTAPGASEQQWQYAMAWVRNNTPEGSIFAHWWDYGYWIQTLGGRPTVTDGGHGVGFWDHTTARYLMTAENEKTTLQLCKAHNVSYVLFDPSDIGKYSAYSSIASDKTGQDRLSWIPSFDMDSKQTQELKNETVYVYTGGFMLDKDLIWNEQLLAQGNAVIPGFLVHFSEDKINSIEAVVYNNNQRYNIPVRKAYYNNTLTELADNGLDAVFYVIPSLNGNSINPIGSALFLSEKVSHSQFARMYLLGDTNFTLIHEEDASIITQINQYYSLEIEFVSAGGGIIGPIKIFKTPDLSNTEYHAEYIEKKTLEEGDFARLDYLGV